MNDDHYRTCVRRENSPSCRFTSISELWVLVETRSHASSSTVDEEPMEDCFR